MRHAYGTEIEVTQLQVNLQLAQRLPTLLAQDTQAFLKAFYLDELRYYLGSCVSSATSG